MANVPDPDDFDHPDMFRDLIANAHGAGGLKDGESAITLAGAGPFGHCVDEMTIEGWLNGQG
ncbi:hypothetical protein [Hoeflea sp.]|uniref:hypothetical protein n=1 Tax=Hoeflea sp. TaxID=1940281 RepID=UPI003A95D767